MRTPKPLRRPTAVAAVLLVLLLAACAPGADEATTDGAVSGEAAEQPLEQRVSASAVVHKSPTCDCCTAHEDYLEGAGLALRAEIHEEDLVVWKEERGIPRELWSCHTTEVGGYLVEGHVPAETIARLLDEQPDIDGIALPGMPAGSPGMPGEQDEPWVIEAFAGGEPVGVFETR